MARRKPALEPAESQSDSATARRSARGQAKRDAVVAVPVRGVITLEHKEVLICPIQKPKAKPSRKKTYSKKDAEAEDSHGDEGGNGEVQLASPIAVDLRLNTKMHQKPAVEQDHAALPTPTPRTRPGCSGQEEFDGVLLDSPSRPAGRAPATRANHSMDRDSEAAEVAKGLQEPGVEGDGEGDEDKFPPDQFEEPPDSDEECKRMLGSGGAPTMSETEVDGEQLVSSYSKALGSLVQRPLHPTLGTLPSTVLLWRRNT